MDQTEILKDNKQKKMNASRCPEPSDSNVQNMSCYLNFK